MSAFTVCCAWLWVWTYLFHSDFFWFGPISYLCSQKKKNNPLRYHAMITSHPLLITFLTDKMKYPSLVGSKHCNTEGKNVWTMLKNKPRLVTFHEMISVRLWTFQSTSVVMSMKINWTSSPTIHIGYKAGRCLSRRDSLMIPLSTHSLGMKV